MKGRTRVQAEINVPFLDYFFEDKNNSETKEAEEKVREIQGARAETLASSCNFEDAKHVDELEIKDIQSRITKDYKENQNIIFFEEDYVSFTVLCFYKENMKLFELTRRNLGELVYHSILVFVFQAVLSYNIFQEVFAKLLVDQVKEVVT